MALRAPKGDDAPMFARNQVILLVSNNSLAAKANDSTADSEYEPNAKLVDLNEGAGGGALPR
jgi:hypothetical protein